MPFDPQVQALRDWLERAGVPNLATRPLPEARAAEVRGAVAGSGPVTDVGEVRELRIPGPAGDLAARLYRPAGAGPWPGCVYFLGGGWSLGTLASCDEVCRRLSTLVPCVTVSVAYRLAPEHRFPAAAADCYAAAAWVARHAPELGADPARRVGAGDSAGGNRAAAVPLLARQRGGPALAHQLLVYPLVACAPDTASMREIRDPNFLTASAVATFWSRYLTSPGDGDSPLASPLRTPDLGGLPSATIVTAEFDPLRDEGEQYAGRLRESGVAAEVLRYDGMMHGFFTMPGALAVSCRAVADAAMALRAAVS